MPDSGAVYQPTTVGYTYENTGDGTRSGDGFRHGFWRIMSRHKLSSRRWFEWMMVSVAFCFIFAGLVTLLVIFTTGNDETDTRVPEVVIITFIDNVRSFELEYKQSMNIFT